MSQSFAHGRVSLFPWQSLNKERSPALPLILQLSLNSELLIANEPAERRRSAGEAAENSAARRMLYAEKFSNDL